MADSEINGRFLAEIGTNRTSCLKAGKNAEKREFVAYPKSLKRCEMKKALNRLAGQGFGFYLWCAEIDLNGVPDGIRTRVARMKI